MMLIALNLNYCILYFFGAIFTILASVFIYYRYSKNAEKNLIKKLQKLQKIQKTANILHLEITAEGFFEDASESLFDELGLSTNEKIVYALDVIYPADHLLVDKSRLDALTLPADETAKKISCDCRLKIKNGGVVWVNARFISTTDKEKNLILVFTIIEDRLRMEELLRDSQRKLANQSVELATQFNAAKSALHARQEVERLAQHDLRSPLKTIESAASLLRKERILSNNEERLLTSIERTAGRALSMVTMSLDLYRMEEGTFQFVAEVVDLVAISRNVLIEFKDHARSKNITLEFNSNANTLQALASDMLTTSIVENLVRNAIEAAPEGSTVTIALYQGTRVGLLIHNNGEVHESIRNNFFQKYASYGKRGGLGLGTYSAKLMARAQGGDLTMTTSAEQGTCLVLKLNRNHTYVKENDSSTLNAFSPSLSDYPSEIDPISERDSKFFDIDLLVVEDDDCNWMLLRSWFPSHSRMRRAINGQEALNELTLRRPDVVLMDLEMPIMSGFEALGQIRAMQTAASEEPSTIYAFTVHDDFRTIQEIESAGFDGILSKPLNREGIKKVLEKFFSKESSGGNNETLWIEKNFFDAFPTFIKSRRALVDSIEKSFNAGDIATAKRAAHTLAGSPAMHGFDEGMAICKFIFDMNEPMDPRLTKNYVSNLRKILSNPIIR